MASVKKIPHTCYTGSSGHSEEDKQWHPAHKKIQRFNNTKYQECFQQRQMEEHNGGVSREKIPPYLTANKELLFPKVNNNRWSKICRN